LAIQLQLRKGNSLSHSTFTGAIAEVTVDTTKNTVVVHDGSTVGGFPLALKSDVANVTSNVNSITTSNVAEGTNLYFTNARVYSNVIQIGYATNANVALKANIIDLTTSNVSEGANLYFTNARVQAYLEETGNIIPSGNNVHNLGSPTNQFKSLYVSGNTIFLGGVTLSSSEEGKFAISSTDQSGNVITDSDLTTDNVIELSNLYFTNTRVYSNVIQIGYATNANVALKANIVDLTTANITELNNLYFTNARSREAISVTGAGSYDNSTGVINITGGVTSVNDQVGAVVLSTANIAESSNLYYTNARVYDNVTQIGYITASGLNGYATNSQLSNYATTANLALKANITDLNTSNVTEGTNLYFSNSRVIGALADNTVTIGNVIITGNLFVQGDTVEFNTATLVIEDKNIVLANGAPNAATADGAGITINGALASFTYNSYSDTWVSDKDIWVGNAILVSDNFFNTSNILDDADVFYTNAKVESFITDSITTSNIDEGSNFYFTNARVYDNVIQVGYATNANVNLKANVADLTTSNVSEGANLYFTNSRVISALTAGQNITIDANGRINSTATGGGGGGDYGDANVYANVTLLNYITASSLSGYATNAQLASYATNAQLASYATNAQLSSYALTTSLTTGNVVELTNLYFTNTRAREAISGGSGIDYNTSTGVIALGDGVNAEFADLVITGNLTVRGETTTINAREIAISDNMIYLNDAISYAITNVVGDGANVTYTTISDHGTIVGEVIRVTGVNPSSYNQLSYVYVIAVTNNTLTIANTTTGAYISGGNVFIKASINPDLGIAGGYNDGTYHHAGIFRDATDGHWKFFENYEPEPDANVYINTAHPTFSLANVKAKYFVGPVDGNVSDISNHTTTNLTEGSNLYFTNTRVYSNVIQIGYATNANVNLKANITDLTTSNVSEGANLYFTNTRVSVAISSRTLNNATFSGNIVTSSNVKASAYLDGSNRRLLIKDANNIIVWGV